jgi:glycosyltransferase involved in cell wall biosynthesis
MNERPIRLAHLVSHPIPYFAPLYRELAGRPEVDLTVYFYSDATAGAFRAEDFGRVLTWDRPLLEGYRYRMLPSASRTGISGGFIKNPNWDIVRDVMSGGYDVVWTHGYAHLTTWLATAAARARGSHLLLRDEQTLLHRRAPHKRALRAAALRAFYSRASALYIGERNRDFLRHYGVPEERLFPARYCVDNAFFRAKATELMPRRRELRASFGIDDDAPVVLFTGKLIEKKQPLKLIEAYARVRAQRPCWLLIAGDGPQRTGVEYLAAQLGAPGVRIAGFLNQTELPAAYAAADVFVLPSAFHETWGLVVNEAMNFGLPVIVSDKVGCGADLVEPGWNGFVVPHGGVGELADAISALVGDAELRARFGARSREIVARYSIEACAGGIVAACQAVTGRAARRPMARAA